MENVRSQCTMENIRSQCIVENTRSQCTMNDTKSPDWWEPFGLRCPAPPSPISSVDTSIKADELLLKYQCKDVNEAKRCVKKIVNDNLECLAEHLRTRDDLGRLLPNFRKFNQALNTNEKNHKGNDDKDKRYYIPRRRVGLVVFGTVIESIGKWKTCQHLEEVLTKVVAEEIFAGKIRHLVELGYVPYFFATPWSDVPAIIPRDPTIIEVDDAVFVRAHNTRILQSKGPTLCMVDGWWTKFGFRKRDFEIANRPEIEMYTDHENFRLSPEAEKEVMVSVKRRVNSRLKALADHLRNDEREAFKQFIPARSWMMCRNPRRAVGSRATEEIFALKLRHLISQGYVPWYYADPWRGIREIMPHDENFIEVSDEEFRLIKESKKFRPKSREDEHEQKLLLELDTFHHERRKFRRTLHYRILKRLKPKKVVDSKISSTQELSRYLSRMKSKVEFFIPKEEGFQKQMIEQEKMSLLQEIRNFDTRNQDCRSRRAVEAKPVHMARGWWQYFGDRVLDDIAESDLEEETYLDSAALSPEAQDNAKNSVKVLVNERLEALANHLRKDVTEIYFKPTTHWRTCLDSQKGVEMRATEEMFVARLRHLVRLGYVPVRYAEPWRGVPEIKPRDEDFYKIKDEDFRLIRDSKSLVARVEDLHHRTSLNAAKVHKMAPGWWKCFGTRKLDDTVHDLDAGDSETSDGAKLPQKTERKVVKSTKILVNMRLKALAKQLQEGETTNLFEPTKQWTTVLKPREAIKMRATEEIFAGRLRNLVRIGCVPACYAEPWRGAAEITPHEHDYFKISDGDFRPLHEPKIPPLQSVELEELKLAPGWWKCFGLRKFDATSLEDAIRETKHDSREGIKLTKTIKDKAVIVTKTLVNESLDALADHIMNMQEISHEPARLWKTCREPQVAIQLRATEEIYTGRLRLLVRLGYVPKCYAESWRGIPEIIPSNRTFLEKSAEEFRLDVIIRCCSMCIQVSVKMKTMKKKGESGSRVFKMVPDWWIPFGIRNFEPTSPADTAFEVYDAGGIKLSRKRKVLVSTKLCVNEKLEILASNILNHSDVIGPKPAGYWKTCAIPQKVFEQRASEEIYAGRLRHLIRRGCVPECYAEPWIGVPEIIPEDPDYFEMSDEDFCHRVSRTIQMSNDDTTTNPWKMAPGWWKCFGVRKLDDVAAADEALETYYDLGEGVKLAPQSQKQALNSAKQEVNKTVQAMADYLMRKSIKIQHKPRRLWKTCSDSQEAIVMRAAEEIFAGRLRHLIRQGCVPERFADSWQGVPEIIPHDPAFFRHDNEDFKYIDKLGGPNANEESACVALPMAPGWWDCFGVRFATGSVVQEIAADSTLDGSNLSSEQEETVMKRVKFKVNECLTALALNVLRIDGESVAEQIQSWKNRQDAREAIELRAAEEILAGRLRHLTRLGYVPEYYATYWEGVPEIIPHDPDFFQRSDEVFKFVKRDLQPYNEPSSLEMKMANGWWKSFGLRFVLGADDKEIFSSIAADGVDLQLGKEKEAVASARRHVNERLKTLATCLTNLTRRISLKPPRLWKTCIDPHEAIVMRATEEIYAGHVRYLVRLGYVPESYGDPWKGSPEIIPVARGFFDTSEDTFRKIAKDLRLKATLTSPKPKMALGWWKCFGVRNDKAQPNDTTATGKEADEEGTKLTPEQEKKVVHSVMLCVNEKLEALVDHLVKHPQQNNLKPREYWKTLDLLEEAIKVRATEEIYVGRLRHLVSLGFVAEIFEEPWHGVSDIIPHDPLFFKLADSFFRCIHISNIIESPSERKLAKPFLEVSSSDIVFKMAPAWWNCFGDRKPDSTAPPDADSETLSATTKRGGGTKISLEDETEAINTVQLLVGERLQALADYLIHDEGDVGGLRPKRYWPRCSDPLNAIKLRAVEEIYAGRVRHLATHGHVPRGYVEAYRGIREITPRDPSFFGMSADDFSIYVTEGRRKRHNISASESELSGNDGRETLDENSESQIEELGKRDHGESGEFKKNISVREEFQHIVNSRISQIHANGISGRLDISESKGFDENGVMANKDHGDETSESRKFDEESNRNGCLVKDSCKGNEELAEEISNSLEVKIDPNWWKCLGIRKRVHNTSFDETWEGDCFTDEDGYKMSPEEEQTVSRSVRLYVNERMETLADNMMYYPDDVCLKPRRYWEISDHPLLTILTRATEEIYVGRLRHLVQLRCLPEYFIEPWRGTAEITPHEPLVYFNLSGENFREIHVSNLLSSPKERTMATPCLEVSSSDIVFKMASNWWKCFGNRKPDSTAPADAVLEVLDDTSKYGIKIPETEKDRDEANNTVRVLVNERLQALADYLIQDDGYSLYLRPRRYWPRCSEPKAAIELRAVEEIYAGRVRQLTNRGCVPKGYAEIYRGIPEITPTNYVNFFTMKVHHFSGYVRRGRQELQRSKLRKNGVFEQDCCTESEELSKNVESEEDDTDECKEQIQNVKSKEDDTTESEKPTESSCQERSPSTKLKITPDWWKCFGIRKLDHKTSTDETWEDDRYTDEGGYKLSEEEEKTVCRSVRNSVNGKLKTLAEDMMYYPDNICLKPIIFWEISDHPELTISMKADEEIYVGRLRHLVQMRCIPEYFIEPWQGTPEITPHEPLIYFNLNEDYFREIHVSTLISSASERKIAHPYVNVSAYDVVCKMAPDWWKCFGDRKPDRTAPAYALPETLGDTSIFGVRIPAEDCEEAINAVKVLVNERLHALADYLIQDEEYLLCIRPRRYWPRCSDPKKAIKLRAVEEIYAGRVRYLANRGCLPKGYADAYQGIPEIEPINYYDFFSMRVHHFLGYVRRGRQELEESNRRKKRVALQEVENS